MKKPNIEILKEYAEGHYNGVFVDGKLLCLCAGNKESDAVRSMIDALILCKEVLLLASIWDKLSDDRKEDFDLAETAITSALKKAGCTC